MNSIMLSGKTSPSVLGTLAYMAPEVRKGKQATQKSDIYSLAVVLYELLTNELPETDAAAVLEQKNIPKELREIVLKGLAREEKIYESVKDLRDKIKDYKPVIEQKPQSQAISPAENSQSDLTDRLSQKYSAVSHFNEHLKNVKRELREHSEKIFNYFKLSPNSPPTFYISFKEKIFKIKFSIFWENVIIKSQDRRFFCWISDGEFNLGIYKYEFSPFCTFEYFMENNQRLDKYSKEAHDLLHICKAALTGFFVQFDRIKTKEQFGGRIEHFLYNLPDKSYFTHASFKGSYLDAKKFATQHDLQILDLEKISEISKGFNFTITSDNVIVGSTENIAVILDTPMKPPYHVRNADLVISENGIPVLVGGKQSHLPYFYTESFLDRLFRDNLNTPKVYLHKSFGSKQGVLLPTRHVERHVKNMVSVIKKINDYYVDLYCAQAGDEDLNFFISTRDSDVVEKVEAEVKQPGCPLKLL